MITRSRFRFFEAFTTHTVLSRLYILIHTLTLGNQKSSVARQLSNRRSTTALISTGPHRKGELLSSNQNLRKLLSVSALAFPHKLTLNIGSLKTTVISTLGFAQQYLARPTTKMMVTVALPALRLAISIQMVPWASSTRSKPASGHGIPYTFPSTSIQSTLLLLRQQAPQKRVVGRRVNSELSFEAWKESISWRPTLLRWRRPMIRMQS